ncbi:hypothetical protein [Vulcanisaeta thermophila]|uniref:hypothetical protein n=1 Tax=Vulcanisaeta thermophila TaxID=867917 RepID=UPI00117E85C5|nr:hypothetical protein [Vulcanisaeta thermophila]
MARTIKIEVELSLFLAVLFGVLMIIELVIYGVSTYYAGDVVRFLGFVPCKPPLLPEYISFVPFAPQGRNVTIGGASPSVMTEFVLNGTYYITNEFYLRPPAYVCVASITMGSSLMVGALNSNFIPRDNYGYIECVMGDGPTWLNVTLGPGAYALVAAVYGADSSSTVVNITILRPVTGMLLSNLVFYPQCGYPTWGEVPRYTMEEKPLFFHS